MCDKLRRAREEAGLTQQGAAERIGIPQSVVSRIETGERRLDVSELLAIARAYGKPGSYFLDPDADAKAD